jgi:hypothetical protein
MLASIYTEMYTDDQYLINFDQNILAYIKSTTGYKIDEKRIVYLDNSEYQIHDVEWVINKKLLSKKEVNKIDMQHILI